MSYRHLLRNNWASSPSILDDDTYLLSEVIFGHMMYHLSTPTSFLSWSEDTPRHIQELLKQTATHHPRIRPAAALCAMFIVLAFKRDNRHFVAHNDEAGLLFMAAFKAVGAASDPTFTESAFNHLTHRRYAGSKMADYHRYLDLHAKDALSKEHKPWYKANAFAVLDHFLVSYLPGVVGELEPDCSRYRFMPLFESVETPRSRAPPGCACSNNPMETTISAVVADRTQRLKVEIRKYAEDRPSAYLNSTLSGEQSAPSSPTSYSSESSIPSSGSSSLSFGSQQGDVRPKPVAADLATVILQDTRSIPIVGTSSYDEYASHSARGRLKKWLTQHCSRI